MKKIQKKNSFKLIYLLFIFQLHMEESQNNKDSRENDNSLLKYMNVFVFKTPASNLISHSKGLTSIFNELRKTY